MKASVSDPSKTRKPKLLRNGTGGKIVSRKFLAGFYGCKRAPGNSWRGFTAVKGLPEILGGVLQL
jgi:hypothetical protein